MGAFQVRLRGLNSAPSLFLFASVRRVPFLVDLNESSSNILTPPTARKALISLIIGRHPI